MTRRENQCPSIHPTQGIYCGFPKGHLGRCGNGIASRNWDYNLIPPSPREETDYLITEMYHKVLELAEV